MPIISDFGSAQFAPHYWKLLRYFIYYRVCIVIFLFLSILFSSPALFDASAQAFPLRVTGIYILLMVFSLIALQFCREYFNWQLTAHVLIDVLTAVLLIRSGEWLAGGLGAMLFASLAGAALVGEGRLVLLYAAIASISVLFEKLHRAGSVGFERVDFFQTGLFCIGFFGVAVSARLLARRAIANEELAHRRGEDLRNQMQVNQSVIEEMQDGVLVLSRNGEIKQFNPRAEMVLGFSESLGRQLGEYSKELARGFWQWCNMPNDNLLQIHSSANGMPLRARFVSTNNPESDVLVFLEDMGRLQEQARQLKLAALGRLTANIAHEIRNPLSAINHAGELLREESSDKTSERLLRIILDNAGRVERIVSDILKLGRRDRVNRERIDLRIVLPFFIDEYALKENINPEVVQSDISGTAVLFFDHYHLHQILWNLVSNALRHSQVKRASVILRVMDSKRDGWVELHVIDDGKGIDKELREQIFEPFFTTDSRGTGLGLYIARELCDANGAKIELLDAETGSDFCVSGRSFK